MNSTARRVVMALAAASLAVATAGTGASCRAPNRSHPLTSPPTAAAGGPDATAGITDAALGALVADHWEWTMRGSPTWATELGDHRFDDRMAMRDAATLAQRQREQRALLDRAQALPRASLDDPDRVTLALFIGDLTAADAAAACHFERWSVAAGGGSLLGELSYLVELHQVHTVADGDHLLARLGQGERIIDDTIANLEAGLAEGRVAPAEAVRRAVAQLDDELAKPVSNWSMTKPAREPNAEVAAWPAAARERFARELVRVVRDQIVPALTRLRDALRDRVLPVGRSGPHEGLAALPDGDRCYQAMILTHLAQARDPRELHELGLREIARTDAELTALGRSALGTSDLTSTIDRLRTDLALRFVSGEALVAKAREGLARAAAAIPRYFGLLPKAPCVVSIIPDYEAPYTTVAYYRQPHPDGSKPGEYFVNTLAPETRPSFEFEALSWHESIPGHHLQIAIAMELGAVPAFRKFGGSTAFVEGWALYAERLADEMGLYTADLDRLGMASYDAWRASRLVVDTGLHALGWTRAEAEAFMLAHTALAPGNISNEVDRYITTPGQALAYKVGQLEIFTLRRRAEAALGSRFRLPEFHDVVLGAGAVTLTVLAERIDAWLATRSRAE